MDWLLTRMKYEIKEAQGSYTQEEKIIEKYAKMAHVQAKVKYGSVYTIEDFIDEVETRGFIPYDGCGHYWDEEKEETTKDYTSFNVDELKEKAETYKYVIWYNK